MNARKAWSIAFRASALVLLANVMLAGEEQGQERVADEPSETSSTELFAPILTFENSSERSGTGEPTPANINSNWFEDFKANSAAYWQAIDDSPLASNLFSWSDQSKVMQAQATLGTPTAPPTTPGVFAAPATDRTGLGWLKNVVVGGSQSSLDVASPAGSPGNAAFIEVKNDAGSLLSDFPGISIGKKAPGMTEPLLKGRRLGQVPARGSYWFPARRDLDTLLSKIDSRLVDNIVTVDGPYSVLFGPGLAFYDVNLLRAPRYQGGYSSFGSTSLDYKSNGEQWYGRQTIWGGEEDWGYRVGYGHRTGSDYESGAGVEFPSSYKSRMVDVALGADLTCDSHIDFSYLRLDQTDVELPGQFFDINFLVTDAYEVVYTLEDQPRYDLMTLETWYNRTRFAGDNLRDGKRRIMPSLDLLNVESTTDVDAMSTGYRVALSWEDTAIGDLTAGTDFRYLSQRLNEINSIPILGPPLNFPLPPAHSSNPGLFVESTQSISERLRVKFGSRVDWVSTNADSMVDGDDMTVELGVDQFDQHFALWAAYVTAEFDLSDNLRFDTGFGHSMRPPTMTELYSVGPFIAVFPQKIRTSLFGNPYLDSERMWQIDAGIEFVNERFSGGLRGFHSWVNDYIAFDFLGGNILPAYSFVNTDLATLAGFELYGDYQVNRCVSLFSSMDFVEGRDHTRNDSVSLQQTLPNRSDSTIPEEPLLVMPPMLTRVGISLHEPIETPRWSIEFAARIVDVQDRFAATLLEEGTPGFTIYDLRAYALLLDNLIVTAGVENLTDKNYFTFYDTRGSSLLGDVDVHQPGINFYFGTELTY